MRKPDSEPIQLHLGEKLFEQTHNIGDLEQNEPIIVPTKRGHCEAKLARAIQAEKLKDKPEKIKGKIGLYSTFKTLQSFTVYRDDIGGETVRWPLPKETIIQARSEHFRKTQKVKEIVIKKAQFSL
jgi:hypothetical protein